MVHQCARHCRFIPVIESIRQTTEALEAAQLHPLAAKSAQSHGRPGAEALEATPCPIRTVFQRDRDRILHCKAFRRLSHKTQVFISPAGDHYRTRLTHTLEVAQIARTIARALRLNEDLTEAIALGHDLGHPPFGHSGEAVLDELYDGGFHHEAYSVRIVTVLEPLNLTLETLEGMGDQLSQERPRTLEAQVVKLADRMTYLNHDVEDAIRAGLMTEEDIEKEIRQLLGQTRTQRLDTLILDLVTQTQQAMAQNLLELRQTPEIEHAMMRLRKWMFQQIYLSPAQTVQHGHVKRVLTGLYEHFVAHPALLPVHFQPEAYPGAQPTIEQAVVDFIAGMTDRYAIETYQQQLLPRPYISKRDQSLNG